MRIHVLQVAYGDDEPVEARRERVAALVAEQRGADLVVLPELWAPGGFSYPEWQERAEPVEGPTVAAVADAARAIGAPVHAGSIIEGAARGADRGEQGRGLWNTSVLLDGAGRVAATYRKIHRFGFGAGEPHLLEAGTDVVTTPLPGSDGVVAGLATCYDLRFPELFRAMLDAGARIVLVPAAWPAARVEHWSLLARARALESQFLVVAVNTAGTHAGTPMGGRSVVVSPTGDVVAEAGPDAEQVLVVDVDLGDVDKVRESFPVLADRRLVQAAARS